MQKKVIFISVIISVCIINADVWDPTRLNEPVFLVLFGIKAGYEFGHGIMFDPEVSFGYIHGYAGKTDLIAGITMGYKGVFTGKYLKNNLYSDLYIGAITEPLIIYGMSGGLNCLLFHSNGTFSHNHGKPNWIVGKKISFFTGFMITGTDITFTDEGIGKSVVSIGQKLALPVPVSEIDLR